ncbi:hypothetical protein ABTX82_37720 [Streptomyces lavendulae]|uniref:hypothetical protein n=1 Tax=Streptomyces lavendulae TaxID=1914 RepID=UPI0033325D9B
MHADKQFDVLALDYTMAREDERTFFNIQAAVAALTVALLAGLATLLSDACHLNQTTGCEEIPQGLLTAAPSIPLAALALLQILGASAALRSYYMRALEKELREYAATPLPELKPVAEIRSPSYAGLLAELATLRRGRGGYRILAILIMLITILAFVSLTAYIALNFVDKYRTPMLIGYGIAFGFLALDVASVTLGARSTFIRIARRFASRQDQGLFEGAPMKTDAGRSLAAYLLVPRPEEWAKWLLIPLSFVATSWGQGRDFHWANMLIALMVTEFLVYSARYQWNDIRGMKDDSGHPLRAERLRLPRAESRKHARFVVCSSLTIAALRLLAAVSVGLMLGRIANVLILVAVVFGFAVVYEALRSCEADHPAAARSLWIIVGAGYTIRFLVGSFAASQPPNSAFSVVASIYFYCFGIMFVLMTWLLEATSFCSPKSNTSWYFFQGTLHRKAHLRHLFKYIQSPHIGDRPSPMKPPDPEPGVISCEKRPVLQDRRNLVKILAPWNTAFLCAAGMSAPTGVLLSGGRIEPGPIAVAVAIAFGASLLVTEVNPLALQIAISVGGSLALLLVLVHDLDLQATVALVAAPWILSTTTYITFRQQSYADLKSFPKRSVDAAKEGLRYAAEKIVGEETWQKIRNPPLS